jgi:hypothetical protein
MAGVRTIGLLYENKIKSVKKFCKFDIHLIIYLHNVTHIPQSLNKEFFMIIISHFW